MFALYTQSGRGLDALQAGLIFAAIGAGYMYTSMNASKLAAAPRQRLTFGVPLFNNLLNRYVATWNEPDATIRRDGIAELWAPEGLHYTQTRKFHGIDELDARVTEAHDQFVAGAGLLFVSENNLVVHHNEPFSS